jgi:uncharacterized protein
MNIITDAVQARELAKEKEAESWRFRTFLKGSDISERRLDSLAREYYAEVMEKIDCCACGHCCTVMAPGLSGREVGRLAKDLQIPRKDLIDRYLMPAKGEAGFVFRQTPCPFLQDLRCAIYDVRPTVCRSFPYLHKTEFRSRLAGVVSNSLICPIVYNVLELLKRELWRGSGRWR